MTVFSGFFNSDSTHDRWYNAQHFSRFFDGLITDGVYYNFPESETDQTKKAFYVKSKNTGRQVTVAQGRGWFRGTWIWNDAPITLEFDALVTNLAHRIDAVVIDCDTSDEGRLNDIKIVKGTEAATSQTVYRPTLIDTETHKQYAIAFVEIIGGATAIAQANITYVVAEPQIDEIGHDAVQPVLPDPQGTPAVEALLLYSNLSKAEMKEYIDTQDAIIQRQVDEMNKPPFEELGTSSDLQRITGGTDADYLYKKVNGKASILTKIALLVNKLIDIGLPVKYGGTGRKTLTTNSVLVGDTTNIVKMIASANGAFYASAANGQPQFGTLPVAQGGTGNATNVSNSLIAGNGTGAVKNIVPSKNSNNIYTGGAVYFPVGSTANVVPVPLVGTLPVGQGGTGKSSNTANSVLVGNGTSAVKNIAQSNQSTGTNRGAGGAFFATAASSDNTYNEPQFGTLPVPQGGTGKTTNTSNSVLVGNGTSAVKNIEPSKDSSSIGQGGAFYTPVGSSTDKTPAPRFGTLPVAQGGTGKTTKAAAFRDLADSSASNTTAFADTDTIIVDTTVSSAATYVKRTFAKLKENILCLKGTTKFTENALAVGTTTSRVYPVQFSKDGYLSVCVPWTDNNTNNAVTQQSNTTANSDYEVLLQLTAGTTGAETGAVNKAAGLKFNPNTGNLTVSKVNGYAPLNSNSSLAAGKITGTLGVAHGGTGTTDGTLNGVKLGTSGSGSSIKYGYYVGSTFKAFKDPTGTASAGDVLSGKTFANAASDTLVTGTMTNKANTGISVGVGTPVTIPAGYYNGSGTATAFIPNISLSDTFIFPPTNTLYKNASTSSSSTKYYFQGGISFYSNIPSKITIYWYNDTSSYGTQGWRELSGSYPGHFYYCFANTNASGFANSDFNWSTLNTNINYITPSSNYMFFFKLASSTSSYPLGYAIKIVIEDTVSISSDYKYRPTMHRRYFHFAVPVMSGSSPTEYEKATFCGKYFASTGGWGLGTASSYMYVDGTNTRYNTTIFRQPMYNGNDATIYSPAGGFSTCNGTTSGSFPTGLLLTYIYG